MWTAMIVDDEVLSAKRLYRLIQKSGKFGCCHSFLHPDKARGFMRSNAIVVVFLDISMPETNGLMLSKQLRELNPAVDVVFVTGHEDYAVDAFDEAALDYLMKPVSAERLARTLGRLAAKRQGGPGAPKVPAAPALEVRLFGVRRRPSIAGWPRTVGVPPPGADAGFRHVVID